MDKVLMLRAEADLQNSWSPVAVGFRKRRQCTEVHGALRMLVDRAVEFGQEYAVAKIDFQKAFDRCRLPLILASAKSVCARHAELDVLVRALAMSL